MNLLERPTFGEVWMDGRLLTPVDPYLHVELIKESPLQAATQVDVKVAFLIGPVMVPPERFK
mgnify:CR=1 FL=1